MIAYQSHTKRETNMHEMISKTYAKLLNVIHFIFFVGWMVFIVLSVSEMGSVPYEFVITAVGIPIVWVIFFGFVSTVISIRETLESIDARQRSIEAMMRSRILHIDGSAPQSVNLDPS